MFDIYIAFVAVVDQDFKGRENIPTHTFTFRLFLWHILISFSLGIRYKSRCRMTWLIHRDYQIEMILRPLLSKYRVINVSDI